MPPKKKTSTKTSSSSSGAKKSRAKKPVSDPTIRSLFEIRDKLLASAKSDEEREKIHMTCKGIYGCPKFATEAERKKCFDGVRAKLKAVKGGGKKRRKSRKRSKSKKKK